MTSTSVADFDSYRELINGLNSYAAIAAALKTRGSVIVGWTDGLGTHYDVLFANCPRPFGELRNGLRGYSDLFVGVLGRGCFGFSVLKSEPRHPNYVSEKLGLEGENDTTIALTALINGVIEALTRPSAGTAQ